VIDTPYGFMPSDAESAVADGTPTPTSTNVQMSPGEAALAEARALRDAGLTAAAERRLRDALAADPGHAEAHGALAELFEDDGHAAAAAEQFGRAAALDAGRTDWLRGQARTLALAGRPEEAVAACRELLARRPDSAAAHRETARLLLQLGSAGEAAGHLREALFLDPFDVDTAVRLGEALLAAGEPVAAIEAVQPALRRDPDRPEALVAAARCWIALDEPAKAERLLHRALAADPEDRAGAGPVLAGLAAVPAGALSRSYVRALFDGYADRFEEHLTGRLQYRAPEVLREMVDRAVRGLPPEAGRRGFPGAVLDVGCGTGLAGPAFRDLASRLHGADLSPRMVAKAAARGVYDRVDVAEFHDALAAEPGAWDLVVAADVLVYLGDLGSVLAAVAGGLAPGGLFAATVETWDGDGCRLGPSRRYAHGEDHVRQRAAAAGLEPLLVEPVSVRTERGAPVPGLALVLRRAA
jgi:predicted TPR repeat methyltransferase/Tfp pilus assembly protein PilF